MNIPSTSCEIIRDTLKIKMRQKSTKRWAEDNLMKLHYKNFYSPNANEYRMAKRIRIWIKQSQHLSYVVLHADRYNSIICVCYYTILAQRNYLTIFIHLKYDASISALSNRKLPFSFLLFLISFTFCSWQKV